MTDRPTWPCGDGEMAAMVRTHDWSATPLGPIEDWPPELKTAASLVLDSGFPMALIWGSEWTTIYNDAFRPILGRKAEALGRSFADIWSEAWPEIAPFVARAFAGENVFIEDFPLEVERSGLREWAWFTFSYGPVRLADGRVAGMLDTVIETTDLMRKRRALAESEQRYRAFTNATSDIVYRMGPDWTHMWELDGQGALADTSEPSADWRDRYLLPADSALVEAAIDRAIAERSSFALEHRVIRADGTPGWVSSRAVPILDEDANIVEWFGTATDITAQKHVQERLRDNEERFRRIVESATDYAIFITDPAGFITDWLPGAEAVFGWSAAEAIGQPSDITFVPEDRAADEPQSEMSTARREGLAPDIRWHLRKDGSRVFIDGSMTPLTGADGSLRGYLKIGQDVTERRIAEQRQRVLLAELQHRVRNTLAVIRSIARRTAQTSDSVDEMGAHLEGRIDAFARVQAMVTRNPAGGVDLKALIEDELLAHATREGANFGIDGPDVLLEPKPAETMSLAFHELATNAVKYGALAREDGRVEVRWAIAGSRLDLTWCESGDGGGEPAREGFGMELLRSVVPYDLRAATEVSFAADGLAFTMSMPLEGNVRRD